MQYRFNIVHNSVAFLFAAIILYIPAMALPVMTTETLGSQETATILEGVAIFIEHGDWPVALIILLASVVVPLFKILGLGYLNLRIIKVNTKPKSLYRLFYFIEFIGKWSMIDIYVIALLVASIQFGNLAQIEPQSGSIAFFLMVICTMQSAKNLSVIYEGHNL